VTRDAFVLGGGGILGAAEAGMAKALAEAGIKPDLILGTSIGAINGAAIAADPTPQGAQDLLTTWEQLAANDVLGGSMLGRVVELVKSGTALHGNTQLREALTQRLPVTTFEDLTVPFECVAASIERASEHWFTEGDLVAAVLASCALPGVFPPVRIGDEHFLDGGLVNSIPLGRAVQRGADTVWVLHVGRVEDKLTVPRYPWEVGFTAFEIARRHRFHTDLSQVPEGVKVHLLPTGKAGGRPATWANLRYRDGRRINGRAEQAYQATRDYLAALS
jgi:NTE family protein